MAAGFLEAKAGGPMMLRTWVNTFLAETWADEGEDVEPHPLMQRREDYGCEVPHKAVLLTAGIDVQSDRIELEIVGWGVGEESWGVFYGRFPGNPEMAGTWKPVEEALSKAYARKDGVQLRVACGLVDSGFATKAVYDWAKKMHVRSIYAAKGIPGQGKPLAGRFGKPSVARVIMFPIGVDTAKELIYSRLRITAAGAGFCHFPMHYDEEWFMQLTAERKVKRYHKGFLKVEWEKVRPRNEALDCRVYAQAALACRNFDLARIAGQVAKPPSGQYPPVESATSNALGNPPAPTQPRQRYRPRQGSSWVGRWRA
jgi:phage terminase large subunit GpA-like protein